MKFQVIEEYIDPLCPSGANDAVVKSEIIEAESEVEAKQLYRVRHDVFENNELRVIRPR